MVKEIGNCDWTGPLGYIPFMKKCKKDIITDFMSSSFAKRLLRTVCCALCADGNILE